MMAGITLVTMPPHYTISTLSPRDRVCAPEWRALEGGLLSLTRSPDCTAASLEQDVRLRQDVRRLDDHPQQLGVRAGQCARAAHARVPALELHLAPPHGSPGALLAGHARQLAVHAPRYDAWHQEDEGGRGTVHQRCGRASFYTAGAFLADVTFFRICTADESEKIDSASRLGCAAFVRRRG